MLGVRPAQRLTPGVARPSLPMDYVGRGSDFYGFLVNHLRTSAISRLPS